MRGYYPGVCAQKGREAKLGESVTLQHGLFDPEFSRQLGKSLQIRRREEKMKGIFLDFKAQARCSVGHQGTAGDTEETLGNIEPSFPPYKKHLDFSEKLIFMLTDCVTGLGFSSSGLEALHRPTLYSLL